MRIRSNVSAFNLSRNHGIVQEQLGKSLEELSSGYRINCTGNSAAGLAISEEICHQINGLNQAMRNVNDGIGMTRTGEGVLVEVYFTLYRVKTLAIQTTNGTHNSVARASTEEGRPQLLDGIDRVSASTDLNQIPLFDTEVPAEPSEPPKEEDDITLRTGHTQKEEVPVVHHYISSKALKLDKTDFEGVGKTNALVEYIGKAVWTTTAVRSSFGAAEDYLEHTHNSLGVTEENMTIYENGIKNTNMASEVTRLTSLDIAGQAAQSIQTYSNNLPEMISWLLQA